MSEQNTQEQIITLELTVDEVNIVLDSLSEMPFRVVNGVVGKIIKQGRPQAEITDEPELPEVPADDGTGSDTSEGQ